MSINPRTTLTTGRKLSSIHQAANAALLKHIQEQNEGAQNASQDLVHVSVEAEESDIITDDGDERYRATVSIMLTKAKNKEIVLQGPWRDSKREAVKDSEVMGRAYSLEGEAGVRRVGQRLERKTWTRQEMDGADESFLDGLLVSSSQGAKQDRLIPPGEGWTRATDEMLWDPRSQVYFVQIGEKAGQYLTKDPQGAFQEVDPPHTPVEHQVTVRAAGASAIRKGAKLERTVLLTELPKIARLALKFPLSFVDTPASAFAIFQGFRSAEAADWCAKNFHTKLIPLLATKIHSWDTKELQGVLKQVLQELDAELLKSTHAFSGCAAAVVLLLGSRLIISGVGQVRAVLLFEDGSTNQLLRCTCDYQSPGAERERVEAEGAVLHGGLLHRRVEGLEDADRILAARHPFEVLQLEAGGPADEKQVRTVYKRLALKVHPDKAGSDANKEAFNRAFARLESAKEAVEILLSHDAEACRELHKVLRAEVHTREGAAELLGVDKVATNATESVAEEAEKAAKAQIRKLEKLQGVARDFAQAEAMCKEAVETLRRGCTPEALPRHEALLRLGVPTSRAMGARDLRYPTPIVKMEPESCAWYVPSDKRALLAVLIGATVGLQDEQLHASSRKFRRHPKAAALRWCNEADPAASSVGTLCIGFDGKLCRTEESGPSAKRQRLASTGQKAGSIMVRHCLIRHQQLKAVDPFARREGTARGPGDAEAKALSVLEKLMDKPELMLKLVKEHSDCQSADQPGNLAGNLGWLVRGQQEGTFDEVAFALEPNQVSDIVSTSRGVHIIQRLG